MRAPPSLKHLAVIMDGNGRWAEKQNRKRIFGHVKGAKAAYRLVQNCSQAGLKFLSLFALSSENMKRPAAEIQGLKLLLEKIFLKRADFLQKEKIQLNILGDLSVFPASLQKLCGNLCRETKQNTGMRLIAALNYGGRQEILSGARALLEKAKQNKIKASDINEKFLSSFFCSSRFPPPDLIIRSGGQKRLSNFYLWSSAYSELYFTETLWPDFSGKNLSQAFQSFSKVKRRFGRI